jgi:hypothetical protein
VEFDGKQAPESPYGQEKSPDDGLYAAQRQTGGSLGQVIQAQSRKRNAGRRFEVGAEF